MESSSTSKRKKRKTRKCLDEIRKRSRRNAIDKLTNKSPMTSNIVAAATKKPNRNCITSHRLTLAMFPKAIRSETITRPTLSDFKYSIKINKIVDCGISTVTSSKISSDFVRNSDEDSINSGCDGHNGAGQTTQQKESNSSDHNHSPSSIVLFNATNLVVDPDMFENSANGETISTLNTPSSQSSRESFGYHLYEEFMNEIPRYLKEHAPGLIKDDVMKKAKTFLHNIYMERCHQECEENVVHRISSSMLTNKHFTPSTTIVQNPMDYLRLGYAWRQSAPQEVRHGSVSGSSSSPCSPPTLGTALAPLRASYSPLTPSIIQDTPEYTYFPHKLNQ